MRYHPAENDHNYRSFVFELVKTVTTVFFAGLMFGELTSPVMGNPPRGNFCTITDIVVFCGTAIDVRSCFFFFHATFPPNLGYVLDNS